MSQHSYRMVEPLGPSSVGLGQVVRRAVAGAVETVRVSRRAWRFCPAALVLLLACGDSDGFSPTEETVAGTYTAGTFTITSAVGTTDLLAAGATVDATLAADGTATGRLFVPGAGEEGEDLDEDLTGTWTLSGDTVTFDQTADTFIRDAEFIAGRNTLTGEGTFSGVSVFLQLVKSE